MVPDIDLSTFTRHQLISISTALGLDGGPGDLCDQYEMVPDLATSRVLGITAQKIFPEINCLKLCCHKRRNNSSSYDRFVIYVVFMAH